MKVKVINNSINELPKYETGNSAGCDVRADFSRLTGPNLKRDGVVVCMLADDKSSILGVTIHPGARCLIPTGLTVEIPTGYEIQVRPRSGFALKQGITVLNSPGTIDADYRGEIGVILINHGSTPVDIVQGERVGQLVLNRVEQIEWQDSSKLSDTERGEGGFGSTGR